MDCGFRVSKLSIHSFGVSRGWRIFDLPCDTVSMVVPSISQVSQALERSVRALTSTGGILHAGQLLGVHNVGDVGVSNGELLRQEI
jgi:hypothetical protein